jgi:uncharacterized RDD family membrane protein YckC
MSPAAAGSIPMRLAARVIDTLVLGLIGWALGRQIGFGYDWLLGTAGLVIVYFAAADVIAGATPGKAAVGLRVLGAAGGKPTPKEALAREWFVLLGAIPFAGPLLALAAWIWMSLTIRSSPLGQGWHDRLAGGTRVVRR